MKLKERAKKLKTDIPAVFLAMKQADTPRTAKLLAAVTIAYALSPIDLIPDFIPVLGYLDDVILLPAMIALTIRHIPPEVLSRCQEQLVAASHTQLKKKWIYALPIVVLWGIIVFVIVWAVVL